MQAKWMSLLEQLNLDIQYKRGAELVTADALSRLCQPREDHPDHLDPDWPNLYNTEYKTKGKDPATHQLTHDTLIRNEKYFHVSNGTVYHIIKDKHIPYIPLSQRVDTILRHHRLLGHTKANNLYLTLKEIVWWPNLKEDIIDVLKKCTVCEKYTSTKAPKHTSYPVPDSEPFKVWGLDVVGAFPEAKTGQRFLIVAIDFATRWPVCWATKDHKAESINRFINKAIVADYGTPDYIITDGAKELASHQVNDNLKAKNIQHSTTSPYRPQAHGRVEQLNGSLIRTLEKIMDGKAKDTWPQYVKHALLVSRVRTN